MVLSSASAVDKIGPLLRVAAAAVQEPVNNVRNLTGGLNALAFCHRPTIPRHPVERVFLNFRMKRATSLRSLRSFQMPNAFAADDLDRDAGRLEAVAFI
jgi:hypothetical protein